MHNMMVVWFNGDVDTSGVHLMLHYVIIKNGLKSKELKCNVIFSWLVDNFVLNAHSKGIYDKLSKLIMFLSACKIFYFGRGDKQR